MKRDKATPLGSEVTPSCPMGEAEIKKRLTQFWGAVSVIKMCRIAAGFHLEHPEAEENDLSYMPEALDFAFENLIQVGTDVFPALTICESTMNSGNQVRGGA